MKKLKKLFARILITIIVGILTVLFFSKVILIKHEQKIVDEEPWNWTKENDILVSILDNKYPNNTNALYPIIMMRDDEIPEKKEDEKRILVVGDSFIFGYGGNNVNYTWWKQLNLKIKEAGYTNVNVYGAGRYFFNTKDELEKILKNRTLMEKVDPDLIIMAYVPNDPEERDRNNKRNLVKDTWEEVPEDNPIYQKSSTLYYSLIDKRDSLPTSEYEEIKKIGERLGFHRWDVRDLVIAEGENLEKYKKVLHEVDEYINELGIPYFYFFLDNIENELVRKANYNVYNAMREQSIKAYFEPFDESEMLESINTDDIKKLGTNPEDPHPGIVWTSKYSKIAYDILIKDYSFIFENQELKDINEYELNINDTTPYLELTKIKKNIYEFYYPEEENERTRMTNFLYLPLEKNYVKLNLEYPKKVSKIIINGDNLKSTELYVNTIDSEYGYDVNDAFQIVTPCKLIEDNIYEVNAEITSINLVATFEIDGNRKLEIEFVEN